VPPRWLHLTTLTSGPADAIASDALAGMIEEAQHLLAAIEPITITLGHVLYHPRALMLGAGPAEPFQPVIEAVHTATRNAGAEQTLLIDDLDGSPADGTVRFALDGTSYEIDLSTGHAQALHAALSMSAWLRRVPRGCSHADASVMSGLVAMVSLLSALRPLPCVPRNSACLEVPGW
jgi:Lsr2